MKTKRIEEQLADMRAKREHAQQIGCPEPTLITHHDRDGFQGKE